MKKAIFSFIIIILFSIVCYPQTAYVGGAVSSSKIGGTRTANIIPEFGYCVNEHNTISLSFGYSTFADNDVVNHSIRVAPCYSYVFDIADYWRLDVNCSVGYSRFFGAKSNRVGLYIGPQIEYLIRPKWTVWCGFDAVEFETEWYDGKAANKNINFNWFNTGINLGFYYYFNTKCRDKKSNKQ